MNVFFFYIEPGRYILERHQLVNFNCNIDFAFIKSDTEHKTNMKYSKVVLNQLNIIKKLLYIWKILRNNDIIIVNGYNHYVFWVNFLLNQYYRKPLFIESDGQYRPLKNKFKFIIKRIFLAVIYSDKKIFGFAGGNHGHRDFFSKYGMPEHRIFLLPMMLDNSKFYPNNNITKYSKFTFLYVGRLEPLKNVEGIIKSFIELSEHTDVFNVELHIVGKGSLISYLSHKYNIGNIKFKGALYDDELIEEYRKAHALILASNSERWGLVVNEALSSGLPVLIKDIIGAKDDLVKNKDSGLVFSDFSELTDKMKELYASPILYVRMSSNALSLMKNYWNFDLWQRSFHKAIEQVY